MTQVLDIAIETVRSDTPSLELRVEWRKDMALSSPFSVPRLMEHFVSLGECGGFAGRDYPPTHSAIRLQSRQMIDTFGSWLMAMSNCDPGAATVLRDIVLFSHVNIAPLTGALVRAALPSGGRITGIPSGYYQPLPFPCEIDPVSDEVHICVQFAARPSGDGARQVNDVLTAWAYVVAAGGFSVEPEDMTQPFLVVDEEPEWVSDEVWLRVSEANVDEVAFDPLLNALHHVHSRIAPIVRVEVE